MKGKGGKVEILEKEIIVTEKPLKAYKMYWVPLSFMSGETKLALYSTAGYVFHSRSGGIPPHKAVEAYHYGPESYVKTFSLCVENGCFSCGYHSCRTEQQVVDYFFHRLMVRRDPEYILCEVDIWGKIVEGKRGYRSQYCFPTKILGSIMDFPCCEEMVETTKSAFDQYDWIEKEYKTIDDIVIPSLKRMYNCK
jgi:hypothetical protein